MNQAKNKNYVFQKQKIPNPKYSDYSFSNEFTNFDFGFFQR